VVAKATESPPLSSFPSSSPIVQPSEKAVEALLARLFGETQQLKAFTKRIYRELQMLNKQQQGVRTAVANLHQALLSHKPPLALTPLSHI